MGYLLAQNCGGAGEATPRLSPDILEPDCMLTRISISENFSTRLVIRGQPDLSDNPLKLFNVRRRAVVVEIWWLRIKCKFTSTLGGSKS